MWPAPPARVTFRSAAIRYGQSLPYSIDYGTNSNIGHAIALDNLSDAFVTGVGGGGVGVLLSSNPFQSTTAGIYFTELNLVSTPTPTTTPKSDTHDHSNDHADPHARAGIRRTDDHAVNSDAQDQEQ